MNIHSLHAPFIYELHKGVLSKKRKEAQHPEIEKVRKKFKVSNHNVQVIDYGSGSQKVKGERRQVSDIASYGLTQRKYAELMAHMIDWLECRNIIELGTSLGINALYLSRSPKVKLTTFEGAPALAAIAMELLEDQRNNVRVVEGNIDLTLPKFLENSEKIDFVFFDANHQLAPTINYFELCLKYSHNETCFVFDDIHLTPEMDTAWKNIIDHYQVTLTIDIFQLGIVFINPELRKQHYVLEI